MIIEFDAARPPPLEAFYYWWLISQMKRNKG